MIDVNVYLSRWPFRRLPHDDTDKLVAKLRSKGVSRVWAGSFDALLHKDVSAVNTRLALTCKQHDGFIIPFGCVNPKLPDWQEDLRRCCKTHGMPGLRLHPNYHGYGLDDPAFVELLDKAAQNGLIVQIAIMMEDERTQHSLVQVPPVDATPLLNLLRERKSLKELRLVILNGQRALRGEALSNLADAGNVYFDFAMQEGVGGLEKLSKHVPIDRILFGSYSPFFYFESAELKLRESRLGGLANQSLTTKNAEKLLEQ